MPFLPACFCLLALFCAADITHTFSSVSVHGLFGISMIRKKVNLTESRQKMFNGY